MKTQTHLLNHFKIIKITTGPPISKTLCLYNTNASNIYATYNTNSSTTLCLYNTNTSNIYATYNTNSRTTLCLYNTYATGN